MESHLIYEADGLLVDFGHYPKVQLERIVAERGRYDYGR
jgi:hypothetical protein